MAVKRWLSTERSEISRFKPEVKDNSGQKSADGQEKIIKTQDKLARCREHFESVLKIRTTVSEVTLDKLKGCAQVSGSPEASYEVVNDGLVCSPTAEETSWISGLHNYPKSYGSVKKCLLTGKNNQPFLYIKRQL